MSEQLQDTPISDRFAQIESQLRREIQASERLLRTILEERFLAASTALTLAVKGQQERAQDLKEDIRELRESTRRLTMTWISALGLLVAIIVGFITLELHK